MQDMWWKIAKQVFKTLVTLGAIYFVVMKVEFDVVGKKLATCNYWFLLLALICYVLSQLISVSRLQSFFKTNSIHLRNAYNLRLYRLGLLYNYFLPGGIGGDAYKIYILKKRFGYSRSRVLSSVFFDRLSGLWALAIFVGVLIIFMPRFAVPNYITIGVLALGTISYYSILRSYFSNFVQRFAMTHLKALCVQGFQAAAAISILFAFAYAGKFSPYVLVFMASSIIALLPSLLGGFGTRELAAIGLSNYLQMDSELAVLIVVFFNIISLLTASTGLIYIFFPRYLGDETLPSAEEITLQSLTDVKQK